MGDPSDGGPVAQADELPPLGGIILANLAVIVVAGIVLSLVGGAFSPAQPTLWGVKYALGAPVDAIYGNPGAPLIVTEITLLTALGLAVLGLVGAGLVTSRRSRRGDPVFGQPDFGELLEATEFQAFGGVISWHHSTYTYSALVVAELALIVAVGGVATAVFSSGAVAIAGALVAALGVGAAIASLRRFYQHARASVSDLALVFEDGLAVMHGSDVLFSCPWAMASFVGAPKEWGKGVRRKVFDVRSMGGGAFRFAPVKWTRFSELRDRADNAIRSQVAPQSLAEFEAGNDVTFGDFTVSRSGVSRKSDYGPDVFMTWSEVRGVDLTDSPISVTVMGIGITTLKITVSDTPDIAVLLEVIDKNKVRS